MVDTEKIIEKVAPIPKGFRELLIEQKERGPLPEAELLEFDLGENAAQLCVYNPAPMVIAGQTYLWERVEETEKDSVVMLFKENKGKKKWNRVEGSPIFKNLQDPFYCGVIDGRHVIGGIQADNINGIISSEYRTVLYSFKESFTELVDINGETITPFATGPKNIKGVRLIEIEPGRIGVFVRPQALRPGFGGRGQIGYFEIEHLDELESALDNYDKVKDPETLLKGLFVGWESGGEEEWGGANWLHHLPGGKIGVLGHIAGFGDETYITPDGKTEHKKDYYPITFVFDPKTRFVENVQIIATTERFPPVKVNKIDLGNGHYSGGLVRSGDGITWYYGGLADRKTERAPIKYPWE